MSHIENNIGVALRDIGIPPRPSILVAIDREMSKDAPDFQQLAKILSADVALSAALLKTTNSPFFGFNKKVRSVQEALLVLGLKFVIQTVAGFSLQKAFKHVPNMERFWDSSTKIAQVSGWLVTHLDTHRWVRPEDAYTFGLFRDCGIPVLMIPFPEYRAVLGVANAENTRCFTDIEDQQISTNHVEIGTSLAESWLLPREIVQGIRYHHSFDVLLTQSNHGSDPATWLIAIAQLAEHLVHARTGMTQTFEWEKIAVTAMPLLNIDTDRVAELVNECAPVINAG